MHECINGHKIITRPGSILQGSGCSICAGNQRKTSANIRQELIDNNSSFLLIEEYINSSTPIKFQCQKCNNISKIVPYRLKDNYTCKNCISINPKLRPTKLYYVGFNFGDKTYYKIGISQTSIKEMFKKEKNISDVKLLYFVEYPNRLLAELEEAIIIEKFKTDISHDRPLKYDGNSEVFNIDILQKDKAAS